MQESWDPGSFPGADTSGCGKDGKPPSRSLGPTQPPQPGRTQWDGVLRVSPQRPLTLVRPSAKLVRELEILEAASLGGISGEGSETAAVQGSPSSWRHPHTPGQGALPNA